MRHDPRSTASIPGMFLAALTLLIVFAGCSNSPTNVSPSPALSSIQTADGLPIPARAGGMSPLWPNEDGRYWRYHLKETTYEAPLAFYDDPASVPPAPSLRKIALRLRSESGGDDGSLPGSVLDSGTYQLGFLGNLTTESGATGQNLVEAFFPDPLPGVSNVTGATPARGGGGATAFWSHLVAARPELAPAVRSRLGAAPPATNGGVGGPILLHGGAFEKTTEHIGTYGDLNRDIAWLYLVANVHSNSRFDLQLVPDLASDVWLHAIVLPEWFVTLPKPAPRVVQVLYLIDYGVGEGSTSTGGSLGAFRSIEYGTVTYVPNVGPVAERSHAVFPSSVGDASGQAFDTRADLLDTGLTAVPLARLP